MILWGGGLGESEMEAIFLFFSSKRGWPGKREAVCPSGPIPMKEKQRGVDEEYFQTTTIKKKRKLPRRIKSN